MKHNIVYKVTNNINGKWYIGVHSTSNVDDNYMGSGVSIVNAINKYGLENFNKEILFIFDNEKEAYYKEAELITINEVKDRMCYNMMVGGKGGWPEPIAKTHIITDEGWIPKKEFNPLIHKGIAKNQVVVKDANGNRTRVSKEDPRYLNGELIPWNKGYIHTPESNIKRSAALKGRKYETYYCESCNKDVAIVYANRHKKSVAHVTSLLSK